ncbi:cystinosin-like protein ERS1 NDAI_0I00330 [Naumovozyma dairenensis CBS 421]|uniref:Uncharacterized protein n=1 Tax=Naumovozyma dairenensis (strain ATCC 10597 / BCRC 20456 / CBS 421 / NBRC 0211 / NRRL Y-12639) TaxID=1071378 RepID=G0WFP1_NAUDC|nr:hypothetical protein NDAI_0I00330 [Naumovozyma dairenensis CBS 421]CCD26602.1 hypothetical protein NDAI_0I00330 [Naumovozyma dairenensis CBS 421]
MTNNVENVLGLIYVISWSISMYPPIFTNWKLKSSKAISVDFVILNTFGYFYLSCSYFLQYYCWTDKIENDDKPKIEKPIISTFDLWYCLHGFVLNLILLSQIKLSHPKWKLWNFHNDYPSTMSSSSSATKKYYSSSSASFAMKRQMKTIYYRLLVLSIGLFIIFSINLQLNNRNFGGLTNSNLLDYCNNLFILKISMSLIKYFPQMLHNFERKSTFGFSIDGVLLDTTGSIASLCQLFIQLNKIDSQTNGDTLSFTGAIMANFGKIGLSLVTLTFNFIFLSQWFIYKSNDDQSTLWKKKSDNKSKELPI